MRVLKVFALVGVASLTTSAVADITPYEGVILGQTQSNPTQFGSIYSPTSRSPIPGDTYDARALLQDGINAFFIDDVPNNHAFGGLENAGSNLTGNAGDAFQIASLHTNLGATELVQVEMGNFSANGALSAWQPFAGLLSPNGVVFTSWRFDMGGIAAGPDDIAWDFDFNVINAGFTVFDSAGASIGTFALTVDNSSANALSGLGVVGIGGGDIGGFDLASFQLFWEIEKIPAPGSVTLLGMCGLIAMRRRR